MDFGIGGLFGAAGSIAGAMINAEEQAETREMNWATNIMNWQQRNREREEAIAMALKQRAEQKLGSTDIRGTRTKFVPGQGWVTTGGKDVLEMMALQDAEQKKVLQHDLPQRRKVADRNYVRGLQDEGTADSLKRMFVTALQPARSDEGYASDLYQAQAAALREASSDAGGRAWSQAFRTGQNSNFDAISTGQQREANKSYAQAALQSKLLARGTAEKEKQAKLMPLANLYNMFAGRAGQLPEANYRPQAIDTAGTLAQSMQGDLSAGGLAAQMYGKKGGELDYIQPITALGNGIAGAGSQLGSMFNRMAAQRAYQGDQGGGGGGLSFGSNSSTGDNNDYYTSNQNYDGYDRNA